MDLIIPLGPDIARFDDRNLYLRTSPEDMADALSRVGPADLRTIAKASPEVASAGLEASLARLEQSDRVQNIEQILAIAERLRSHLRGVLTAPTVYDVQVGGRIIGDRVLTADERARIETAVGGGKMAIPEHILEAAWRKVQKIFQEIADAIAAHTFADSSREQN